MPHSCIPPLFLPSFCWSLSFLQPIERFLLLIFLFHTVLLHFISYFNFILDMTWPELRVPSSLHLSIPLSHCNYSTGRNDEHDSGGRFKTKLFTWTEKQGYIKSKPVKRLQRFGLKQNPQKQNTVNVQNMTRIKTGRERLETWKLRCMAQI